MIAPKWLKDEQPSLASVVEGEYSDEDIANYNKLGYNIYFRPNYPTEYRGGAVNGTHINKFDYVFVDMDLKDKKYESKQQFLEKLLGSNIPPTSIIDSGGGVHVYWSVLDLDAKSFLRLNRRLMRFFNTDPAVSTLPQLMRLPNTLNTKVKGDYKPCKVLDSNDISYSCEQLDKLLPPLTIEDEEYCVQHYNKTFNIDQNITVNYEMPKKFGKLLSENLEVKELWASATDDRSRNDFRLGHIMFANGFTKEEAVSVLVNSAKALSRAPIHGISYATNIVDKIWTYELQEKGISSSVSDILERKTGDLEGVRFPCYKYIDDTQVGFRLGHVMGLVAGSGVGKTAMALNLFLGFVASNPEYDHFFCPLEQTDKEIASRWKIMCGENTRLHNKVHIISNYDENGKFRDLSLEDIKNHILEFKEKNKKKIGCVVIDHIGVLCNNNKLGQEEGIKNIAKAMKGFATETNTFLIMQSQTARSKAGIGDLELDKDAAFGTSVFENFCDYLVTLWQPLKRVYSNGAPTIMAYKFCKIRHKVQGVDNILEDKPYALFFDPITQLLRPLTQDEQTSFKFFLGQATNKRKNDRRTELVEYTSVKWDSEIK